MPQRRVKIAVEFYNDAEKEKLLSYANHEKIEEIVKSGLEVTTEEFLTYYLFHKKRPGKVGWRNHREIGRKIPASRHHGELAVFDYIETFYNTTRRHSSLGQISPVAFENKQKLNDIKAA
jgi:transposase InsO family protein